MIAWAPMYLEVLNKKEILKKMFYLALRWNHFDIFLLCVTLQEHCVNG